MTPADYRATLERLGLNQVTVAPLIGVDPRTSRRYASAGAPETVARLLAYMESFGTGLAANAGENKK